MKDATELKTSNYSNHSSQRLYILEYRDKKDGSSKSPFRHSNASQQQKSIRKQLQGSPSINKQQMSTQNCNEHRKNIDRLISLLKNKCNRGVHKIVNCLNRVEDRRLSLRKGKERDMLLKSIFVRLRQISKMNLKNNLELFVESKHNFLPPTGTVIQKIADLTRSIPTQNDSSRLTQNPLDFSKSLHRFQLPQKMITSQTIKRKTSKKDINSKQELETPKKIEEVSLAIDESKNSGSRTELKQILKMSEKKEAKQVIPKQNNQVQHVRVIQRQANIYRKVEYKPINSISNGMNVIAEPKKAQVNVKNQEAVRTKRTTSCNIVSPVQYYFPQQNQEILKNQPPSKPLVLPQEQNLKNNDLKNNKIINTYYFQQPNHQNQLIKNQSPDLNHQNTRKRCFSMPKITFNYSSSNESKFTNPQPLRRPTAKNSPIFELNKIQKNQSKKVSSPNPFIRRTIITNLSNQSLLRQKTGSPKRSTLRRPIFKRDTPINVYNPYNIPTIKTIVSPEAKQQYSNADLNQLMNINSNKIQQGPASTMPSTSVCLTQKIVANDNTPTSKKIDSQYYGAKIDSAEINNHPFEDHRKRIKSVDNNYYQQKGARLLPSKEKQLESPQKRRPRSHSSKIIVTLSKRYIPY